MNTPYVLLWELKLKEGRSYNYLSPSFAGTLTVPLDGRLMPLDSALGQRIATTEFVNRSMWDTDWNWPRR